MVLGRQAECDLQLTEGHASRRHAKLFFAEDARLARRPRLGQRHVHQRHQDHRQGEAELGRPAALRHRGVRFPHSQCCARRRRRQDAVSRAGLGRRGRGEQRCLQASRRVGGSGRDGRWREQDEVHRSGAAQADDEQRAAGHGRQHRDDRWSPSARRVRQPRRVEHQAHGRRIGRAGVDDRQPGGSRSAIPGQRRVGAARQDRQRGRALEGARPDVGERHVRQRQAQQRQLSHCRGPRALRPRRVHLPDLARRRGSAPRLPARPRARRPNRRARPC